MNKNVLLIAVGGIGFRHFQALLNCRENINLYVVDLSEEALSRAKEYADSTDVEIEIQYYKDISGVPQNVDVAIIATSSKPRRKIFEELISTHNVKNIIFEKVLFTKTEDYAIVANIIKEKRINAYVDCIARTYPIYHQLRKECKDSRFVIANMRGGNWGLACNAIHLVDQLAFIADADTKNVHCVGLLKDEVEDSKREGYVEFYGKLVGDIGANCSFSIECNHSTEPLEFEFVTDKYYYCVNEVDRKMVKVEVGSGQVVEDDAIEIRYVSQVTNINVDKLLRGEEIDLPSFDESRYLHEALHDVFLEKYNAVTNSDGTYCPIT